MSPPADANASIVLEQHGQAFRAHTRANRCIEARAVIVATGRQIAWELAPVREVSLSMGEQRAVTPQRILGKDVIWWAHRLGLLRAHRNTLRGRLARRFDSFPGRPLRPGALRRRGVTLRARSTGADSSRILFGDGTSDQFRTVIWTVGYRDETSWLKVPGAISDEGLPLETDGMSPVAGLFYVSRHWQTCRGSALLHGVGLDAARIAAAASETTPSESGQGTEAPSWMITR